MAQLSYNSVNMGLGGGGTAYLQGSEALFVNPANLHFSDRETQIQISLFQNGFHFDSLLPTDNLTHRLRSYRETISFNESPSDLVRLDNQQRNELINRNYPNGADRRNFMSQAELHWIGISWRGSERAYAFALKTRIGNHYQLGKGVYESQNENFNFINQSFIQRYQVLHEFSFGYSESFTFLNGQIPRLSEFIIGVAPKLVVSGAGFEVDYKNQYTYDEANQLWNRDVGYVQQSSGLYSVNSVANFRSDNLNAANHENHGFNELFQPTGYGAGIELGITYMIRLHRETLNSQPYRDSDKRSVRLSFSLTDMGFLRVDRDPYQYKLQQQILERVTPGPITNLKFTGAPNEFYYFLSNFGELPNFEPGSEEREPYLMMLPASIQSGFLFHYEWLKLTADASYSLVDNAFKPNGFITYLGTEIKLFDTIPLRAGTRLGRYYATYYSFGTGLETRLFDINAAILLNSGNGSDSLITSELVGASIIGLTIHL